MTACALAGATVQGAIGFGLGLLATPILVLIDPAFVPGPLLFSSVALSVLVSWRERRSIAALEVTWALAGRFVGTAAGAAVMLAVSGDGLAVVFGMLVLAGVGMSASGVRLVPRPSILVGAGALSGLMATVAAVGGPPMALVYQDAPGSRIRGTMSGYFVVGALVSILTLVGIGRFGWLEVRLGALLLPGVLVGYVLSRRVAGYLDRGSMRRAVLFVSMGAALVVIARAVL